ncbi:MAG: hypothetical protein R6U99_01935 [Nioella sp.]
MGKIIKRTEEGTGFIKRGDDWFATQKVEVDGETYEKDEKLPEDQSANYIRSNKSVAISSEIEYFAEQKGISYNEMKTRLGELKSAYRGAVKYSNIGINKNGRLYDKNTGRFVKETDDLKKLQKGGYLDYEFEDYEDARIKVTGS